MSNCLPCRILVVERTAGQLEQLQAHPDLLLSLQVQSPPCVVCFGQLDADDLLVCDACNDTWHYECVDDLSGSEVELPWTCPMCNLA